MKKTDALEGTIIALLTTGSGSIFIWGALFFPLAIMQNEGALLIGFAGGILILGLIAVVNVFMYARNTIKHWQEWH